MATLKEFSAHDLCRGVARWGFGGFGRTPLSCLPSFIRGGAALPRATKNSRSSSYPRYSCVIAKRETVRYSIYGQTGAESAARARRRPPARSPKARRTKSAKPNSRYPILSMCSKHDWHQHDLLTEVGQSITFLPFKMFHLLYLFFLLGPTLCLIAPSYAIRISATYVQPSLSQRIQNAL